MTLAAAIAATGVEEVVHFTTNRGLVGILAENAILSRRQLPENKYLENVAYNNSKFRPEESAMFDKSEDWLDYINLSISEINSHFFDISRSWHRNNDVWWVILAFAPDILKIDGVYFGTTNNKYDLCDRARGEAGFRAMFNDPIPRLRGWFAKRMGRAPHLATCQQAEVLYPVRLGLESLRRIYVSEPDQYDVVRGWLREWEKQAVEVIISPQKFEGAPN